MPFWYDLTEVPAGGSRVMAGRAMGGGMGEVAGVGAERRATATRQRGRWGGHVGQEAGLSRCWALPRSARPRQV